MAWMVAVILAVCLVIMVCLWKRERDMRIEAEGILQTMSRAFAVAEKELKECELKLKVRKGG